MTRDVKAFDRSARAISREMNKWGDGNKANFGFISDENGVCRVFAGGEIGNIIDGIAVSIVQLCQLAGDTRIIKEITDLANKMVCLQLNVPVQ